MRREQILEILENYKLRIPPKVLYDLKVDIVNEEEFEWCETCKEYDQEKHCCHRWSKEIRNTVKELRQEYIEREVLDKIKAKIEQSRYGLVNDGLDLALNIIDECVAESEEKG